MDQQQEQQVNEAAEKFAKAVMHSYQVVADRAVSGQHLSAELTQHFFNEVVENLLSQAERNREMARQWADQQRPAQALSQEAVYAYMDFINSMYSYYQGNVEQAHRQSQQAQSRAEQSQWWVKGTRKSRAPSAERNKEAIALLDDWLADDSGYDEETWPELKASLNRDRLSDRKLFVD